MLDGEHGSVDFRGHMVLTAGPGQSDHFEFRVRCSKRGDCTVNLDGVIYPVPATMTAPAYFAMIAARSFPPPPQMDAAD